MSVTAVITGGTRGIGRGLAQAFLERGACVALCGRSAEGVTRTVQELGESSDAQRVLGLTGDVTRPEDMQRLFEESVRRFGGVDIWINNAGLVLPQKPLEAQDFAALRELVDVNLYGTLVGSSVALRGMRAQGRGQIWNMEGLGSRDEVQPGLAAYGATKRAVRYLNKALLRENAKGPVQICTLSPGIVVTDLLVGDYDANAAEWQRARRVFNILGDRVETVTPWLVDRILATRRSGTRVAWLTTGKAMRRFLAAPFRKRDLFAELGM